MAGAQLDSASRRAWATCSRSRAPMRRLAVESGKIASDLRLLGMGPRAGLSARSRLPAVQPGSSIMPGKVNPSIPEMVNQVCFQVIGLRHDGRRGGEAGPARAERDDAGDRVERAARRAHPHAGAVDSHVAHHRRASKPTPARCRELLDRSTAVATALSLYLGYAVTADVAKASIASGRSVRDIVLERGLMDAARLDEILLARGDDHAGHHGEHE